MMDRRIYIDYSFFLKLLNLTTTRNNKNLNGDKSNKFTTIGIMIVINTFILSENLRCIPQY